MYRIDYNNINEAVQIIYCFMTIPVLSRPECTVWSDSGFADTLTNDGTGFMSENEFCDRIISSGFAAISCIASTDKTGSRRVVLNLMPDTDFLVLNFLSTNSKPNEAERRLLQLLEM